MVNDPMTNINRQSVLVVGRDFAEGDTNEIAYLDQFSSSDPVISAGVAKSVQQAVFELAAIANRSAGSGGHEPQLQLLGRLFGPRDACVGSERRHV